MESAAGGIERGDRTRRRRRIPRGELPAADRGTRGELYGELLLEGFGSGFARAVGRKAVAGVQGVVRQGVLDDGLLQDREHVGDLPGECRQRALRQTLAVYARGVLRSGRGLRLREPRRADDRRTAGDDHQLRLRRRVDAQAELPRTHQQQHEALPPAVHLHARGRCTTRAGRRYADRCDEAAEAKVHYNCGIRYGHESAVTDVSMSKTVWIDFNCWDN